MSSNSVANDTFVCVPLRTLRQAEQLRVLRNSCAPWMTGNSKCIGKLQQAAWFLLNYKRHTDRYTVWLYYRGCDLAGYGALSKVGRWIGITEAVAEAERGKGLGTRILKDMLSTTCPTSPVFVNIFTSNTASIKLHMRAGFVLAGRSETSAGPVYTFVLPRHDFNLVISERYGPH